MSKITCQSCGRLTPEGGVCCEKCGHLLGGEETPTLNAEVTEEPPSDKDLIGPLPASLESDMQPSSTDGLAGETVKKIDLPDLNSLARVEESAPPAPDLKEPKPAENDEESINAILKLLHTDIKDLIPGKGKSGPETQSGKTPPAEGDDDEELFRVEWDRRSIFVQGLPTTLSLRITPLMAGLRNICVWLKLDYQLQKRKMGKRQKARKAREIYLSIDPPTCGAYAGIFYIQCEYEDEKRVFEGDLSLVCFPRDATAQSVLRDITLNIQNDIKTGHAADVRIHSSLGELDRLKASLTPDSKIEEVLKQIQEGGHAYSQLELFESAWEPPADKEKQARNVPVRLPAITRFIPEKGLTVREGDSRLHLLTGDTIGLGVNRQNSLVTRLFDPVQNKTTRELNGLISKFHCRIARKNGDVFVYDGRDGVKGSTNGTFLDERRVAPDKGFQLDNKATSTLLLAGSDEDDDRVFGLAIKPLTCSRSLQATCQLHRGCSGQRNISCLYLTRMDHVKESYLILWGCCAMKLIDESWDGLLIWQQDGGFGFSLDGRVDWLSPGSRLPVSGKHIDVSDMRQVGL